MNSLNICCAATSLLPPPASPGLGGDELTHGKPCRRETLGDVGKASRAVAGRFRVRVCRWRQMIQPLRTSYLGEAGTFPWPVLIPATRYKRARSPPIWSFFFVPYQTHCSSNSTPAICLALVEYKSSLLLLASFACWLPLSISAHHGVSQVYLSRLARHAPRGPLSPCLHGFYHTGVSAPSRTRCRASQGVCSPRVAVAAHAYQDTVGRARSARQVHLW